MSTRIRWMVVSTKQRSPIDVLVEGIEKDEYLDGNTSGFLVQRRGRGSVAAQYIERFERVRILKDPFGEEYSIPWVEYFVTNFRFFSEPPQLEILNGPRSASPLLNRLGVIFGLGSVCRPAAPDLFAWLRALEPAFKDTEVLSAFLTKVSLSENVAARIQIAGSVDVRGFFDKVIGKRNAVASRLDISASLNSGVKGFSLRAEGRAVLEENDEQLAEVLRIALSEALQEGK